jgi:hypothetical protein
MAESLRRTIEDEGDTLADLHLWRLGPLTQRDAGEVL